MKIVKNLVMTVVVAGWVLGAGMTSLAEQSIALVNMQCLFDEHPKTKVAQAQLKEQATEAENEINAMIETNKQMKEDFEVAREEAQNTALSDEKRDEKRTEAEDKLIEIREYESRIQRAIQAKQKQQEAQSLRLRKAIVDEIRAVINAFAAKQKFTLVVDSSGQTLNALELVLYSDKALDITDQVLAELAKAKADAEPAE